MVVPRRCKRRVGQDLCRVTLPSEDAAAQPCEASVHGGGSRASGLSAGASNIHGHRHDDIAFVLRDSHASEHRA
eukprot:35097-Eustigmatos_ZCMA.PRE.1